MFASHANEILRDRQTIQFIDEFLQYVTQLPNTFVIDANTLENTFKYLHTKSFHIKHLSKCGVE